MHGHSIPEVVMWVLAATNAVCATACFVATRYLRREIVRMNGLNREAERVLESLKKGNT